MSFAGFVRAHLPPPPARVLEVGAVDGALTTDLAVAGYDALGIDPASPPGERFRRLKLEDLEDEAPFDAIVGDYVLHRARDLASAVERIHALLAPAGILVLEEPAWDRLDESTLDWFYGQRRALAAAGVGTAPESREDLRAEWEAEHLALHGFRTLEAALERRFEPRELVKVPALHRALGGVAAEVLEQALVDAGAIEALAFRFVGAKRRA